MGRLNDFVGIETDFPDLADVPDTAETNLVVNGKDYNATPAQIIELAKAAIVEAINSELGNDDWQSSGEGGEGSGNLVDDTSPQLGANLDLNSFTVGDATAADLTKLHALTATSTELNYVDGVTSAIQTQLDAKVTGPASVTDSHFVQFDTTTGKLVKGGLAFVDEDDMASDSATNVPSQQSVKAYVDGQVVGNVDTAILALPDGTIYQTHGGATPTYAAVERGGVSAAAELNEGAFLGTAALAALTTITDAAYTIQPEDYGKDLYFTHATPTITVAAQATEAYADGFYCQVTVTGTATLTFAALVTAYGSGSSAEVAASWTIGPVPSSLLLRRLASNSWLLRGDVTLQ